MNLAEAIFIASGIALLALLVWNAVDIARTRQRHVPPPVTAVQPKASRWTALPGNRLEFGASGFAIELNTGVDGHLYYLATPEGRRMYASNDLEQLKAAGERLAADRDEFARFTAPALPPFHR